MTGYTGRAPYIGPDAQGADSEAQWMIRMLRQTAESLSADAQADARGARLDKYRIGALAQRRLNLLAAADYIERQRQVQNAIQNGQQKAWAHDRQQLENDLAEAQGALVTLVESIAERRDTFNDRLLVVPESAYRDAQQCLKQQRQLSYAGRPAVIIGHPPTGTDALQQQIVQLTANALEAAKQLSTILSNGNASEWEHIFHAAESLRAERDALQARLTQGQVEEADICGLCGESGADKVPHPVYWPNERMPDRELVHAECEVRACHEAHAALSDAQRVAFLRDFWIS